MVKINFLYAGDISKQDKTSRFNIWRLLLALVVPSLLLVPAAIHSANGEAIVAPTILAPAASEIITKRQPYIRGVTLNNTLVDVYVDGVFNGRATVKDHPSGTASWAYQVFLPLGLGQHTVHTVARSPDEIFRSPDSRPVSFDLETPLVAPSSLRLKANPNNWQKPLITGRASVDTVIEIFLDGVLAKALEPTSNEAEKISFQFEPDQGLMAGWHSIKARVQDSRGKYSAFSQPLIAEIRAQGVTPLTAPALAGQEAGESSEVSAPTLLRPENSSVGSLAQPAIVGLAHNNQQLQIFIDDTLNGELRVGEHSSGVAGFAYNPFLPLSAGEHTAYARAIDERGQASSRSNILSFFIRPTKSSFIVTEFSLKALATDLAVKSGPKLATEAESGRISSDADASQRLEETPETGSPAMSGETLTESGDKELAETDDRSVDDQEGPAPEPSDQAMTDSGADEISMIIEAEASQEMKGESEAMSEAAPETTTTEPDQEAGAETSMETETMSEVEPADGTMTADAEAMADEDQMADAAASDEAAGRIVVGSKPRVGAGSGNILLIAILAIAVVIIVGVISWLTTRPPKPRTSAQVIEYVPPQTEPKGTKVEGTQPKKPSDKSDTQVPPPPDARGF